MRIIGDTNKWHWEWGLGGMCGSRWALKKGSAYRGGHFYEDGDDNTEALLRTMAETLNEKGV